MLLRGLSSLTGAILDGRVRSGLVAGGIVPAQTLAAIASGSGWPKHASACERIQHVYSVTNIMI